MRAKHRQGVLQIIGPTTRLFSDYYSKHLCAICRENVREKEEKHKDYNHTGNLPIYITSVSFFGPDQTEVWLLGQTWGLPRHRECPEQKQVATWNTSWLHYKDTGSLSSWQKLPFTLTLTTHTWQALSLVFTRVPLSPTLCLTRQFHYCTLSDKPSWSSHMLLSSFWSNRQLLCAWSALHSSLPAPGRHLQAVSRIESTWAWGDPHGISSVNPRIQYPLPCHFPAQLPPSHRVLLLFCCYTYAFEEPGKIKTIKSHPEAWQHTDLPIAMCRCTESISPVPHAVLHSSHLLQDQTKFPLTPTGTLPEQRI